MASDLSFAHILDGFFEGSFGHAQRNAGVQATLGVERGEQFLEAALAQDHVLQRHFDVVELDLCEVLAAHGVVTRGHFETGVVAVHQHAPDAIAARRAVDAGKHHEPFRFVGATDQRLDAIDHGMIALDDGVCLVVRHVGAGMRLGHADGQVDLARGNLGQNIALHALRREVADDAHLNAQHAHQRHGSGVAILGDFFDHQRGIEYRQVGAAVLLGNRHAQHADLGQLVQVLPWVSAVQVLDRISAEVLVACQLTDRVD